MGFRKWKDKPYAIVHPRRGQKYRVAQMCAAWHVTGKPSVGLLADVFGISPGLIYAAMSAARPHGHDKSCARPAKSDGDTRPAPSNERRPVVRPTITPPVVPVTEPVRFPRAIPGPSRKISCTYTASIACLIA